MRVECDIPNTDLRLLVTDNNNHHLVKKWIECAADDNVNTSKLNDNPYQYDRLIRLHRMYNVIISRNGLPYYGHFVIQYPKLPNDVARIFARAYKTKLFSDPMTRKFWMAERVAYKNALAPLLIDKGIGTLFWTRHAESVGKDTKWERMCHRFGYPLKHKNNIMFRQNIQNVHYFNIWGSPLYINDDFIERLPNA